MALTVETLTGPIVPDLLSSTGKVGKPLRRQQWLVRIVVSLLTDPADNEGEGRELIERFVLPAVEDGTHRRLV